MFFSLFAQYLRGPIFAGEMTLYVNVLGAMFSGNTGDLDEFVVGMEVGAGLEAGASVRSRSY